MAIQLSASIYRIGSNDLKNSSGTPATMGVTQSFPTQGIRIYPVPQATTANNVAMATVIALLPTGLNQTEKLFYTPTATATVITAANA